jgi:hypothetical protein
MDSKEELNDLCKKIKGLIPSKRIGDDVTDSFKQFISDLGTSGIDPHEIDCIIRSYNYFNVLLGDPHESLIMNHRSIENVKGQGSGSSGSSVSSSSGSSSSGSSSSGSGSGISSGSSSSGSGSSIIGSVSSSIIGSVSSISSGSSSVSSSGSSSGSSSSSDKETKGLFSLEEQLQLLLTLYPKYRAIKAMETLAEKVLTEVPILDLAWINGTIPMPKEPNTIVNRVSYQVEIAKKLNDVFPCPKLIEYTENVLEIASNKGETDLEQAQEKVKTEIKQLSS